MKLFEHLFQTLAPDECLNCSIEGALLCSACIQTSFEAIPERCYRCYRISTAHKTCPVCRGHSVLKHAWIRTEYNETARKIVHALKFTFTRSAARVIARELAISLPDLPKGTILVHVPAATTHIRKRGFDQSALIARELSRLLNFPHVHALARTGQQRQVGASSQTRRQQMQGAFRAVSRHMVKDSHILLVDDVLTIGSTLEMAGLELKLAGAKSVSAVAFAQAK